MRAKPNTRNGKNVKTNSNSNSSNNSNKFPLKKPLKENVSTSNQPDNSVLRPPVDTSIAGLKQAVKLFETGTPEVVHLLSFECDVIYECRVCRNLFRSIANFISHKRVYCTRRFNHVQNNPVVEDHTILVEEELGETGPTLPLRITARQDLTSILQSSAVRYYKEVEDKLMSQEINRCDSTIHLQPIESTTYGFYQTVGKKDSEKLKKNQVSELNKIISKNEAAVLGPDGKIIREGARNIDIALVDEHVVVDDLICQLCKIKFATKKTLSHHTKTVHESFRVCYSCPCCKNLFSNTWSVHRHLYKVHRKSSEQVRRLRAQIQKKQVRAEKLAEKFNRKSDPNKSKKEENKAWMEHFEDDSELQRCGGCGRRFERRAALTSHAQICHKRIAACNSIQNVKRKEDKSNETQNDLVAVPIKQQSTQGSPMQKVQSEKRIGIQVRMNYCKSAVGSTGIETRRSERHKSCEEKDDDVIEIQSLDSILRDRLLSQSTESIEKAKFDSTKDSDEKCSSNGEGNVNLYSNSKNRNLARKTSQNDSKIKMKRLESISTQLRKVAGLKCEDSDDVKNNPVLNCIKVSTSDSDNKKSRDATLIKYKNSNKSKLKQNDKLLESKSDNSSVKTESDVLNISTSKRSVASSSKEGDEESIDFGFSILDGKGNRYSNEELKSDVDNKNQDFSFLSSAENADEYYVPVSLKNSPKTVPVKDILEKETSDVDVNDSKLKIEDVYSHSLSDSGDKGSVKDSVGILTRFKVRSIFKSDGISVVDNSGNDTSDQEELSITDESSLKENLNETVSNDQPLWMKKKMSQYIHYKNKQCLICLKKFKMLLHIKHHVADHLGWNNYHCLFSNCSYATFSKSDCIKHLMKMHLKSHEKHRALSLVGELGQIKTDNCDIEVKCKLSNVHKRKKSDSEEFCVQQAVLKESAEPEFKVLDKDSVTVVSINDDSSEVIIAEECVHTSKVDSSCSEHSDVVPRIKKKFKRRKVGEFEKHSPSVRKCSPDSTTELTEKDLKTAAVGAQFRDVVELSEVIIDESRDDMTSFTKLEEISNESEHKTVCNIPDNKNVSIDQHINAESVDSDIQGKGRDTEEEDEMQDIGVGTNMDDGNLRRMVMEVIFGGQVESTKTDTKQCPES